jgi:hypothetical protein
MEDGDEVQPLTTCPVRNNEPGVRDNKLASSWHSARAPHPRLGRQNINGTKNSLSYQRGILLRILRDAPSESYQVPDCPGRPYHLHRGALVSPFLPQDRSHFDIFS